MASKKALAEVGVTEETKYLRETAEMAELKSKRKKQKAQNAANSFGWSVRQQKQQQRALDTAAYANTMPLVQRCSQVFNQDAMVRAHEKRTDVLASGQSGGSTGTGLHYGQVDGTPSEVCLPPPAVAAKGAL